MISPYDISCFWIVFVGGMVVWIQIFLVKSVQITGTSHHPKTSGIPLLLITVRWQLKGSNETLMKSNPVRL